MRRWKTLWKTSKMLITLWKTVKYCLKNSCPTCRQELTCRGVGAQATPSGAAISLMPSKFESLMLTVAVTESTLTPWLSSTDCCM